MTFNEVEYRLSRKEPIEKIIEYLTANEKIELSKDTDFKRIHRLKQSIRELSYSDFLVIQSSPTLWHQLMQDPDFHFRRWICKKTYNLTEAHLMKALKYSSGAANKIIHETGMPEFDRACHLGVLFGHPWQLINKKDPDEFSYAAFSEYFYDGVAKRINIKDLGIEKTKVTSITGYVITDPEELFPKESAPVTGRWVTTYREMDYFEFHLSNEPFFDLEARKRILNVFPEAHDILTTYIPFRPTYRAVWVINPKGKKTSEYVALIKEFTELRLESIPYYSK